MPLVIKRRTAGWSGAELGEDGDGLNRGTFPQASATLISSAASETWTVSPDGELFNSLPLMSPLLLAGALSFMTTFLLFFSTALAGPRSEVAAVTCVPLLHLSLPIKPSVMWLIMLLHLEVTQGWRRELNK